MAFPNYDDLMNPTIQAIKSLGGEGHIREIESKVAQIMELKTEEINEIHRGTTTKLVYRLAWSRNYLKRFGILENVARGIWALTDEGRTINEIDKEEVKSKVKYQNNEDQDIEKDVEKDITDGIIREKGNSEVEKELPSDIDISKPFDPKKIDITSKTLILDALFKRLKRDEINLFTDFQRQGDLWDSTKQSRLIESILIRFPLPAFYFDGSNDNSWQVVDGLQRISCFKNFVVDQTLKLENLEFLTQFNGCTFDTLPRDLQRRVEEAEITVYIINPGTPDEVKYNIFKRINTGGLVLEPQEIRHAINQGIPALFVKELADLDEFQKATCYAIRKDRMLDRDFTTRFLSFYINDFKSYQSDLDTFMNKSMSAIKNLSEHERNGIRLDFAKSMRAAYLIFGDDAFRKRFDREDNRKPINKALFEVWSVALAQTRDDKLQSLIEKKDVLIDSFIFLMNNDIAFNTSLSSGTGDKARVIKRFTSIFDLIQNTLSQ